MIRRVCGVLFLALSFSLTAWSQAPLEIPVQDGETLMIRGEKARLVYQIAPEARALNLQIAGGGAGWTWKKADGRIWIEQSMPSSRQELRDRSLAKEVPTVTLRGPALPIEIHLNDGQVQMAQSGKPFRATMKQGRVTLHKNSASARVSLRNGQIDIQEHRGQVDLDVYEGTIVLKKIDGDVKAELFSPDFSLEGGQGQLRLISREAKISLNQWKGGLRFETDRGQLSTTAFQGRIDGESGESNLVLGVLAASDIHLKSQKSRITIQLPPRTGASLNLVNTLGDLVVAPKEVRVVRTAKERLARGQIPGGDRRVSVFVRANDGTVIVK